MTSETDRPVPDHAEGTRHSDAATLTALDLDAMEELAAFETEHRRILSMQSLYYRRRKAGGAA